MIQLLLTLLETDFRGACLISPHAAVEEAPRTFLGPFSVAYSYFKRLLPRAIARRIRGASYEKNGRPAVLHTRVDRKRLFARKDPLSRLNHGRYSFSRHDARSNGKASCTSGISY